VTATPEFSLTEQERALLPSDAQDAYPLAMLQAGLIYQSEITRGTALGWPYALARYYFCPHRDPIQSAAEGVDALRRGVHPAVRVETFR